MTDAIILHARRTRGFDARVAHASALLREAAEDHAGRIVQASSLGAEGMVLTDLIARQKLPVAVATLDTGMLHAQTRALLPAHPAHYGIEVQVFRPRVEAVVQFVRRHGERAMFDSVELRKACCAMRKVEPMQRLLAGRSAWITGLRRAQSDARGHVPFFDIDDQRPREVLPAGRLERGRHLALHRQPRRALQPAARSAWFPSIGCAPCTRAVSAGEDPARRALVVGAGRGQGVRPAPAARAR